jgi:hypothetical protein
MKLKKAVPRVAILLLTKLLKTMKAIGMMMKKTSKKTEEEEEEDKKD